MLILASLSIHGDTPLLTPTLRRSAERAKKMTDEDVERIEAARQKRLRRAAKRKA
jgi:hypothetical protein